MSKDTIYREDAINLLWYFQDECCSAVVGDFEKLPSADRPQGKWILFPMGYLVCSVCGSHHSNSKPCNYCDNCGAHMKGADDEY